jgi:hypothetical protein
MLAMLDQLATDPAMAEWRKSYIDSVRKSGGQISGDTAFTQSGILAMADQAIGGINRQIEVAKAAGRQGDVTALRKKKAQIKATKSAAATIDEKAEYEDARRDFMDVIRDPNSTLAEQRDAINEYKGRLLGLAHRADRAGDSVMAGKFNQEFLAANGGRDLDGNDVSDQMGTGPTMWESSRAGQADRKVDDEGAPAGDAVTTMLSVRENERKLTLLSGGAYTDEYGNLVSGTDEFGNRMFAQVRVDEKGSPTADTRYPLSVLPVSSLSGVVYVPTDGDPRNGKSGVLTAIVPKRVTVRPETEKDVNGVASPITIGGNADTVVLGGVVTMPDGSTLYSYTDSTGAVKYTDAYPFTKMFEADGAGGYVVKDTVKGAAVERIQNKGIAASGYVQENFHSSELNKSMATTVFNSPQAWEMARDPVKTYSKYTPEDIDNVARAQSAGDPNRYTAIRDELDNQRAEYVRSGGLNYDQTLRLASARMNGDLPLLSDYVGGVTVTGFDVRGTRIDTKEGRALAEKFGGGAKENANLIADAVQKQWGYTPATLEKARTTGVIEKFGPPLPTTTQSIAQQSRSLADYMVKDIWWNVTKPVTAPAAPKPTAPTPPRYITGGGRGPNPPAPTPPPPKPKAAPPPPKPKPAPPPVVNPYTGFTTSGPAAGPNAGVPVVNSATGFTVGYSAATTTHRGAR